MKIDDREARKIALVWACGYSGDLDDAPDTPKAAAKAATEAEEHGGHIALSDALTVVKAAGYRVSKPKKIKATVPLGLNAVGKPFSPQYDPNYRLRHKPSYGHLRLPYPTSMQWVEDEQWKAHNAHLFRNRPQPESPTNNQNRTEAPRSAS